jgi:hypothetical protein
MNNNPRILIVTYNWPPRNAMGTHRPYAWARYWSEAGAKVTVLTAKKQFIDEPLDLHLPVLDGVEVIELSYGLGDHSLAKRMLRSRFVLGWLRRLKGILQKRSSKTIDPRSKWFAAALPLIDGLAKRNDFVVSTFGPSASHLIAHSIKRSNPTICWVADYRDLWNQHANSASSQLTSERMWAQHEATVGEHADIVTAVSEDMVRVLSDACKGSVFLAPNGFDVLDSDLKEILAAPVRRSSLPIKIVHTGTVYRGHRDPTPLLEVLAGMVENGEILPGEVFVDFYGRAVDPIRDLQRNSRFSHFLRVFGHVSREEAIQAQRDADILLLLESSDSASRGILTGKIFEYISAGRPVMCVGSSPTYEIGLLLQRTGTGRVVGRSDEAEIRLIIKDLVRGSGIPSWFSPDIDEILSYSRRNQSLLLFDRVLSRHNHVMRA